ncbi:MAG: hypothetical protein V1647_06720 [Pseudomonadota bacterium]
MGTVAKKEYNGYEFIISSSPKINSANLVTVVVDKYAKNIELIFNADAFNLICGALIFKQNITTTKNSANGIEINLTQIEKQEFSFKLFEELNLELEFLLDNENLRLYLEDNLIGKNISIDKNLGIKELLFIYKNVNYLPSFLKSQMALKSIIKSYDQNYPYYYYVAEEMIGLAKDALNDNSEIGYNGETLLHEVAHALHFGLLLGSQGKTIQGKWIETEKQFHEYISDYSKPVGNPLRDTYEDLAEHVAAYIIDNAKSARECPNKYKFLMDNVFSFSKSDPSETIRTTTAVKYKIKVPENNTVYITDGYDNIAPPYFTSDVKANVELLVSERDLYIKLKITNLKDDETPDDIKIEATWGIPGCSDEAGIKGSFKYKVGDDIYIVLPRDQRSEYSRTFNYDPKQNCSELNYKLEHFYVEDSGKKRHDYVIDLQGKLDFAWGYNKFIEISDYWDPDVDQKSYNSTNGNEAETKEYMTQELPRLIESFKEQHPFATGFSHNAEAVSRAGSWAKALYWEWVDEVGKQYYAYTFANYGALYAYVPQELMPKGNPKLSKLYFLDYYGNHYDVFNALTDQEKQQYTIIPNGIFTVKKPEEGGGRRDLVFAQPEWDRSLDLKIPAESIVISQQDTDRGLLLNISGSVDKDPSRLVFNIYEKDTNDSKKEAFYKSVEIDKSKISYNSTDGTFKTSIFLYQGSTPAGVYRIYPKTDKYPAEYDTAPNLIVKLTSTAQKRNYIKLDEGGVSGSSYFSGVTGNETPADKYKTVKFEIPVVERREPDAGAIKVSGTMKYRNRDEEIIREYKDQVAVFDPDSGKYYLELNIGKRGTYENGSMVLSCVKTRVNNAMGAPSCAAIIDSGIDENTIIFEIRTIEMTTTTTKTVRPEPNDGVNGGIIAPPQ